MKVNFFKLKENKRFYYKSRYYKGVEEKKNIYEISSKFDLKNQEMQSVDYKRQWEKSRKENRNRDNSEINNRLIIIIVTLVLVALYILDFDISIFKK